MTFRVEFTDRAEAEVQDTIFWLIGNVPEFARSWQEGLDRATASLAEFPRRCGPALDFHDLGVEVRQLRYGKYRIIFTLVDADGDGEDDTVSILHVRHGSRGPLEE